MASYDIIATAAFGLETLVVRELRALGYVAAVVAPGRVQFTGDIDAICQANLWLRTSERVLIRVGSFHADDFGLLFDGVNVLAWEQWIPADASFPVNGRSHKSQLSSVPACQRMTKKAIVERLRSAHGVTDLPETGCEVPITVELLDNTATLLIDTSGIGLHKRGYRRLVAEGQLRETLAAAMIDLSVWTPERPLVDPFCGTGTIAIEAAMIGRQIAPGLRRQFIAETWPTFDRNAWQNAREQAKRRALPELPERIVATDRDPEALSLARYHAEQAGVAEDVHFQQRDFHELSSSRKYGCVVTNPPYGMRVGDEYEAVALYRDMPLVLRGLPTWSHYILTANDEFEQLIGQAATKRRKLYNGMIRCTLYQFLGPKPPHMQRQRPARDAEEVAETDATEVSAAKVVEKAPREIEATGSEAREVVTREDRSEAVVPERFSAEPAQLPRPQKPRVTPVFGGLPADIERERTDFTNRLTKRDRHLRRWPTRQNIDCYRLYERDIPEIPLAVDRYADTLHIAVYARPYDRTPAQQADWLDTIVATAAKTLEVDRKLVFVKHRDRQRGAVQYQRVSEATVTRVVHEGELKFQVNLSDYIDTGLFLDHRVTRKKVLGEAKDKRFLNLFAYTGSFTVAAAVGGASQTVTVDLSRTYLDWAADNLKLNGITDLRQHTLVRADTREWLADLPREPLFDLAVVDPPTFSNSKSTDEDWDTQRDHAWLLPELAKRMAAGGVVYFSTNFRRFKLDEVAVAAFTVREISHLTVPEDFRNRRIHRCWRLVKKNL